jgi:transcriptional regulator with XRE-family HTH domain
MNMETKRKLGKYIAELRITKGMAKSELAERMNVSENTVDRWESSRLLPTRQEVERLAEILFVSPKELIDSTSHGPLPEKGNDLNYEQQMRKKENVRYLLLAGSLALIYGILYYLAVKTDILAGLFPALIALTITVMIIGVFLLGKAIHGTLYTHTDWRRYLLAGFCLIVVPLSFLDWMSYQAQRESQGHTSAEIKIENVQPYTDLDLSGCQIHYGYENSGWFGSGTRVYILKCDDSIPAQILADSNWKALPADEAFYKLVKENIRYGPENDTLPDIKHGYWHIACNTGEEVIYIADPEAGIRDFIAIIYDTENHLLYLARYSS